MIGNRAGEREPGCALPFRRMAVNAGRRLQRVVVAHMAGGAGRRNGRNVHSRQGKPSHAVIERSGVPTGWGMAVGTVRRRESGSRSRMHGSGGLRPSRQMALRVPAISRRDR